MAKRKYFYNDAVAYANKMGGVLLSTENDYKNVTTILDWECVNKHKFSQKFVNVYAHHCWCPQCNTNVQEEICRFFMEKMFDKPFKSSKPAWLKNTYGNQLYLDGFNEELKLAFEHNGPQHYKVTSKFHYMDNEDKLIRRQLNDKCKINLCSQNNIKLIIIPNLLQNIGLSNLENFIIKSLEGRDDLLDKVRYNNIDFKEYIPANLHTDKLKEMHLIAKERNGKCLSEIYISTTAPVSWKCEEGHIWTADFHHIKSGTWCPKCGLKRKGKYSFEDVKNIVESNNCNLLTENFNSTSDLIQIKCYCGNVWCTNIARILLGKWCKKCSFKKIALKLKHSDDILNQFASVINCKVFTDDYDNNQSKIKWECLSCKFEWRDSYVAVKKRGYGCQMCRIRISKR